MAIPEANANAAQSKGCRPPGAEETAGLELAWAVATWPVLADEAEDAFQVVGLGK
jgi:hypothetical protein